MIARPLFALPIALPFVVPFALMAAPAAAELWVEVDRLPGDIAVELDAESVEELMDGANLTLRATFRKELPNAMMETLAAVDCTAKAAKIRGIRLTVDGKVATETMNPTAEFQPVAYGSVEAIYLAALCHDEIAPPPLPELDPAALDGPVSEHDAGPEDATAVAPEEDGTQ